MYKRQIKIEEISLLNANEIMKLNNVHSELSSWIEACHNALYAQSNVISEYEKILSQKSQDKHK